MSSRVAFSPDDTVDWGLPLAAPGLLLDVSREAAGASPAYGRLEAAPDYRLRWTRGGQPLFWARIDGWWDRCGILRGPPATSWHLPALSAADVREVTAPPGSEPWWEAWTWRLGRLLAHAPEPVLPPGRWCLRPLLALRLELAERYPISTMEWRVGQPPVPPHLPESVLHCPRFVVEDWSDSGQPEPRRVRTGAVMPLRAPSPEDDGRVKSWRKRARDGTLPPVVLLYVDLLMKWLVLDGHDRLHAARLEGVTPPLLGLWPVREEARPWSPAAEEGVLRSAELTLKAGATPALVERVNRMLRHNFAGPHRFTVTRAWPVRGGVEAWRAEVLAHRRHAPFPVEREEWRWFTAASP